MDVSTVDEARELDASAYYRHLVDRNKGLVPSDVQRRIHDAKVLVAGCGSVGGAAVQPLTRIGFRDFRLADSGSYELNNLNRQAAFLDDLGKNKATAAAEAVRGINPYADIAVFDTGVTQGNADALVDGVDVIVDGVDVTTNAGFAAKIALHEVALARRKPLITGWDLAGVMCAQYFDYRQVRTIFDGAIDRAELDSLAIWEAVFRIAPMRHMPGSMLFELSKNISDPEYSVPQLPEAAWQFGSLACYMALRVISGKKIPRNVPVDVHWKASTLEERMEHLVKKPLGHVTLLHALGLSRSLISLTPAPSWVGRIIPRRET
ncbi:ThiF family protein [Haloechinothrix alba]|uniref:ThiF family protein n=2 Tax=Haloechinothrix alba TaxID=664784 RepID=A0A238XZ69_9PSEU|nr:ThiF family protein [Haloechinothrix alba]